MSRLELTDKLIEKGISSTEEYLLRMKIAEIKKDKKTIALLNLLYYLHIAYLALTDVNVSKIKAELAEYKELLELMNKKLDGPAAVRREDVERRASYVEKIKQLKDVLRPAKNYAKRQQALIAYISK